MLFNIEFQDHEGAEIEKMVMPWVPPVGSRIQLKEKIYDVIKVLYDCDAHLRVDKHFWVDVTIVRI